MIAPAFAEILRTQRDAFNARFTAARRRWTHLDATDFSLFLRDQLSPLVAAVASKSLDHANRVAHAGYNLGLQLVAEKLAGPSARHASLNTLWSSTFPHLAPLIATDPRSVLASLSNATHQLATSRGIQTDIWFEKLRALGPQCSTAGELLTLAQLLAWRAGLAHYRESALTAADTLSDALALAAIDAPASARWPETRAAFLANPWHTFSSAAPGSPRKNIDRRRVGAFRGFGGLFVSPPTITTSGEHLLVSSGDDAWLLIADVFGATFHRASPNEIAQAAPAKPTTAPAHLTPLPAGHALRSSAQNKTTSAYTSAQSHSIWIGPAVSA